MKLIKLSNIYIGALITMPIHNLNINLGIFHLKFFQVFTLFFLIGCFYKKLFRFTKGQLLALFLFLAFLLAVIFSSLTSPVLERSLPLTFALFFCFLFFVATILYIRTYSIQSIFLPLTISGAVYAIWGGAQLILFFLGKPAAVNFEAWDIVPRVPYFSSENVHAAFAVITALIGLFKLLEDKRLIIGIIFILNVIGLVATGTRGAMLMFALASIMVVLHYFIFDPRSRTILIVFGTFVVGGVFYFWDLLFVRFNTLASGNDGTAGVRFRHYEEMYHLFIENLTTGYGLGASQIFSSSNHDVHNVLLMLLFETGIVSFCIFLVLLIYSFSYFLNTFRNYKNTRYMYFFAIVFFAVWGQGMFEPSTFFFHLYLSLGLLFYVPKKT